MKVHLTALGCRLNQGEIDSMARDFARRGDEVVAQAASADLFVVNTCAVTQEAVRSSRQLIYRLHRANPQAEIAVTGCYSTVARDEVAALPGVVYIVHNAAKETLVSLVSGKAVAEPEVFDEEPLLRNQIVGAQSRTRAFIKVQDGCDRQCSFCITRVARGKGRSRELKAITAEIRALHTAGCQEAVLTGVHLGSYGHDLGQPEGLYHLLRAVLDDTDIPRIRLSSLEPWGVSVGFFGLWENPRLCRHLHLPLQSGCDSTLRRMIRRTSQREFRAVMDAARGEIPDVAIATDVIVGFPGETDAEFEISRQFIAEMDFADMHVFRYSQRPGTAAARLPAHVSAAAKHMRSDVLQALNAEGRARYARRFVGRSLTVLWEAVTGATEAGYINSGYTDNYLRVRCIAPEVLTNRVETVRLTAYDAAQDIMQGELAALSGEKVQNGTQNG